MLICIFGESCTGKSTLAHAVAAEIPCEIMTGKDYLRLAKNEAIAQKLFQKKLCDALTGENLIWVVAEPEHLALLPQETVRILVTAELEQIKARFAQRMRGNLPAPVAAMLEKKHGCFDAEPHEIHVVSGETDPAAVCRQIRERLFIQS